MAARLPRSPNKSPTNNLLDLAEAIYSKTIPLLLMNLDFMYTELETRRTIRSTFMTRLDNVMVQWEARNTAQLASEKV